LSFQAKIEALNDLRRQIKTKVDEVKYSGVGGGHRRKLVDDHEEQLANSAGRLERSRMKYERLSKVIIAMKGGVGHLQVRTTFHAAQLQPPPFVVILSFTPRSPSLTHPTPTTLRTWPARRRSWSRSGTSWAGATWTSPTTPWPRYAATTTLATAATAPWLPPVADADEAAHPTPPHQRPLSCLASCQVLRECELCLANVLRRVEASADVLRKSKVNRARKGARL
jgi:hypothetical protein